MLILLAFLALRFRKGWLRRRRAVQLKPGPDSSKLEEDPTPKAGFLGYFGGRSSPDQPAEVVVRLPLPPGPSASEGGRAGAGQRAAARDTAAVAAAGSAYLADRLAALRSLEAASLTLPSPG